MQIDAKIFITYGDTLSNTHPEFAVNTGPFINNKSEFRILTGYHNHYKPNFLPISIQPYISEEPPDTTPPVIMLNDENKWRRETTTISGTVTEDKSTITNNKIYAYSNGNIISPYYTFDLIGTAYTWSFSNSSIDTTTFTNGTNYLLFIVTNSENLVSSNNFNFLIDNENPIITSSNILRATNSILYGLNLTGTDLFSGIKSYIIGISNGTKFVTNNWSNWTGIYLEEIKTNSVTNLQVQLMDNAGNISSNIYFNNITNITAIDLTPPDIVFTMTNIWLKGKNAFIYGKIIEDISLIKNNKVFLYTNNNLAAPYTSLNVLYSSSNIIFFDSINTKNMLDGTNIINLTLTNTYGLFTNKQYIILVDNTPPENIISSYTQRKYKLISTNYLNIKLTGIDKYSPTNKVTIFYTINDNYNPTAMIVLSNSNIEFYNEYISLITNITNEELLFIQKAYIQNYPYPITNGGTNIHVDTPIILSNEGTNIIKAVAVDMAGNISSIFSFTYIVEKDYFIDKNISDKAKSILNKLPQEKIKKLLNQNYLDEELEYLATGKKDGALTFVTETAQDITFLVKASDIDTGTTEITINSIKIYNRRGKFIKELKDFNNNISIVSAFWNKTDKRNKRVKTDVYFAIIKYTENGKIKIIKRAVIVTN